MDAVAWCCCWVPACLTWLDLACPAAFFRGAKYCGANFVVARNDTRHNVCTRLYFAQKSITDQKEDLDVGEQDECWCCSAYSRSYLMIF
jgi:hypothetical protein